MVPGVGPQPCMALICGEAPGRDEVKAGRPFVGKSGKLLDSVLRSLGVAREEVYITNVCKELPLDMEGKIRRPYPEEIEAWRPILEGEIASTAPKAILALGKTAFFALSGVQTPHWAGAKIDNVYGAWHPAYLLYGGWNGGTQETWQKQIEAWAEAWRA